MSNFLVLRAYLTSTLEIGGAAEVNQVPPQASVDEMEMLVFLSGLTDGEVRTNVVQMAQAITLQAQAMIAQEEQQGVPRKNPPTSTMDTRLRDFMRMNPPIYTGSKTVEDIEEECKASMLHTRRDFSRLMVCVKQVEENRKRKHIRAGKRSRQA